MKKASKNSVRIITTLGLLTIIYTSFVVYISQTGPDWEVPQNVMFYISILPVILLITMILIYKALNLKLSSEAHKLKRHVIIISCISFIFSTTIAFIDIYNWPLTYPTISKFLNFYFLLVVMLIAILEFIYINKKLNDTTRTR
ncbi:conserved membrane protein of unknown function [Tenacibaculum jejuense]|uniref:Uncharacterized protein n=1 Tax=Tenacibaculum jejuense TaxID=584609 RepID=A0A238U667_9FLAO|nr:conserved membrane protein of unknown function [Tenacibaculum jejuense]